MRFVISQTLCQHAAKLAAKSRSGSYSEYKQFFPECVFFAGLYDPDLPSALIKPHLGPAWSIKVEKRAVFLTMHEP